MRRVVYAAVAAQLLFGTAVYAKDHGKHSKHHEDQDDRTAVDVHLVFSPDDTRVIREYYEPRRPRSLPPGLQKKYDRTGRLPPGWEKKMEPMPVVLERRLPPLPSGYHRGVFEGHAVIYRPGGRIIDATVIF
jgi:hypothetical protein